MRKEQAFDAFWNSFGVKAYDSRTVPDNAPDKKITYEMVTSDFNNPVPCTIYLYDRSTSWKDVTDLQYLIDARIKDGGINIPYDDGCIWICKASPFATRLEGESDTIRLIAINLQIEYLEV